MDGQHRNGWFSTSRSRKNADCHGFQDKNRYTIRRLVRTICAGTLIQAFRKVEKSIHNKRRFSSLCFSFEWPRSGSNRADQAFKLQAKEAITFWTDMEHLAS